MGKPWEQKWIEYEETPAPAPAPVKPWEREWNIDGMTSAAPVVSPPKPLERDLSSVGTPASNKTAPEPSQSPTEASVTTKTLPRGMRSNNPGNIERNKDRWIGMSADQTSDPRFVVFDKPDHGIRALMRLLINYQELHGLTTIREVINRWAPPVGRDQNDREYTQNTTGYINHVSRLTGYDPDESLDMLDRDVIIRMSRAIIRHENGDPKAHNMPEYWYDDATYSRAAVLAGFQEAP